jgi:hypothetical protein
MGLKCLLGQRIISQNGGESDLVGALNAHEGREADEDSEDE